CITVERHRNGGIVAASIDHTPSFNATAGERPERDPVFSDVTGASRAGVRDRGEGGLVRRQDVQSNDTTVGAAGECPPAGLPEQPVLWKGVREGNSELFELVEARVDETALE